MDGTTSLIMPGVLAVLLVAALLVLNRFRRKRLLLEQQKRELIGIIDKAIGSDGGRASGRGAGGAGWRYGRRALVLGIWLTVAWGGWSTFALLETPTAMSEPESLYSLSASVNPPASGIVTPSEGNYAGEKLVTVRAVSVTGYQFSHWSGDAAGAEPQVDLVMNSAKKVVANFEAISQVATEPGTPTTPATPTTPGTPTAAPTPTTTPTTTPAIPVGEKPQYGGTLALAGPPLGDVLDPAYNGNSAGFYLTHTHDKLLMGDWTKSSAGTGETSFLLDTFLPEFQTGYLAESWELPDPTTIILRLRQGVYWQDKPPANGREFTADDVAFSFNRLFQIPESPMVRALGEGARPTSILVLDKYTLEVKVPEGTLWPIFRDLFSGTWPIDPQVVEQDGDYGDWQHIGGTGPFQLESLIPDSMVTFVRNPNYWMRDPLTGMALPYVDGFVYLMIQDRATQFAALRTGKIDLLGDVQREDKDQFARTNPQLSYKITGLSNAGVAMRTDVEPFTEIGVRRALFLATDNELMRDVLYKGDASILNYPVLDLPDLQSAYVPLERLDEETQELFTYDSEKAKELLIESGYPNGFWVSMVVPGFGTYADEAAILQELWSQSGIEVELQILERDAYYEALLGKTYDYMILVDDLRASSPFEALTWASGQSLNLSIISDSYLDSKYDEISANLLDPAARTAALREVVPYILSNAWYLQYPSAHSYTFWQPWLKNYDGEAYLGYGNSQASLTRFGWIDQDIKEELTGTRD